MSNRNQGSVSAAAREIRETLAAAQEAPAPTAAIAPPAPVGGMRVTKDGQLVPPGVPVPKDANGEPVATSLVPDATFHCGESR